MAWYSKANQTVKGNGSGPFLGGPFKGVLHTTEGGSGSGAISAFRTNNSWPHFLVDYAGAVWQFIDTNQGARALRNLSGGVQTNLDSAIQIEIVGYASQPNGHPVAQIEALKSLMRWIESTTGVKPVGPGRAFASAYGQNSLRFSPQDWDNFNGWCGHCHVPENDHWDPGAINISLLLPVTEVKPMYDPPLVLEPIAASLEFNGGTYLAASSGAFYAFGAPAIRGPNGQAYFTGRKVAQLYPGNSTDPVVPSYITRISNGVIVRTTSNEWYGPYTPSP